MIHHSKKNDGVQSVKRALSILNAIARHDEPVGVRELSNWLGLKPPTTHALLKTLASMLFVEQLKSNRKYCLGIGSLSLGLSADKIYRRQIIETSQDILAKLSDDIDETVGLYGIINGFIFCLDAKNRQKELSAHISPNSFVKIPHHTASGSILLAFSDAGFQEKYADMAESESRLSPFKSKKEMLNKFKDIRQKGYAELENVNSSGVYALSVPVKGLLKRYDLAIGVCMPVIRKNLFTKNQLLSKLSGAAEEIENRINPIEKKDKQK